MKHKAVESYMSPPPHSYIPPPRPTPYGGGGGENSSQHFLEAHLCPTPELAPLILSIPRGGYHDFPDEHTEPLSGCLTQGHPSASGEVRTELRQLGQEPVSLMSILPHLQTAGLITEDHRDSGNQKSGLS